MLTFHPLALVSRHPVADDAFCLEFRPPAGLDDAYRFEAGQHLALRATINGRELRRTYSIVSPVGGNLKIGVRVQGEMSRYLASALAVGETIDALAPTGRFKPSPEASSSRTCMALAAGSGITPILSIVATILANEPASRFIVVYGNRSSGRAMFLEELFALKNRYLDRLSLQFLMTQEPQDVDLFNGRLDADRLRTLASSEFDVSRVDEFFLCGPDTMVKDLTAALRDLGATGKIHSERFSVDSPTAARVASAATGAPAGTEVTITMDGRRRTFRAGSGATLLEAGEAAGLALPYSCRAGVCSTCRAKVVDGTVAMDRNQALEDWEIEAGFVLCCQARPTSPRVEISYDEK